MAQPEQHAVLRQTLEDHKRELRLALGELKDAGARIWPDPRERIRSFPVPWLLGTLLVGLWLGGRTR